MAFVPVTVGDVTIRSAAPHDLPAIMELIHPFMEQRRLLERDEPEVARLATSGFVAETAGRLIAFAAVEVYSKKLAEIQCLAVAAEFHGRGIGKRLVHHCVELARQRGVRELMAITASEEIFRQCGFDYSLPDQKKALFIQLD